MNYDAETVREILVFLNDELGKIITEQMNFCIEGSERYKYLNAQSDILCNIIIDICTRF